MTESVDEPETSVAMEAVDGAASVDVVKPEDVTPPEDVVEPVDVTAPEEAAEPVDGAASVEAAEPVDGAASVEAAEPVDGAASVDTVEPEDRFKNGTILTGKVVSVSSQEAVLDLGDGAMGVLNCRHYTSGLMVDLTVELKEGDELEAAVLIREDHLKRVVISRIWARSQRAWQKIIEAQKSSEVIEARVVQTVKGGLAVLIDEVRGFLPKSLVVLSELGGVEEAGKSAVEEVAVDESVVGESEVEESMAEEVAAENSAVGEVVVEEGEASKAESTTTPESGPPVKAAEADQPAALTTSKLEDLVGLTIACKVIESNQSKNRFVVSHRAAVWAKRNEAAKEKLQGLSKGDLVEGKVVDLVDYGAFVNIGGIRGLLHRKETAWNHGPDPEKLFAVGDNVTCIVAKVNPGKGQVIFSLRAGENPIKRIEVGQVLTGRVDRIVYSGVIVALDPELLQESAEGNGAGEVSHKCQLFGFVPVEEMSENQIRQPQRLVVPGDEVAVKIMNLDKKKNRVDLSIIEAVIQRRLLAESNLPSGVGWFNQICLAALAG